MVSKLEVALDVDAALQAATDYAARSARELHAKADLAGVDEHGKQPTYSDGVGVCCNDLPNYCHGSSQGLHRSRSDKEPCGFCTRQQCVYVGESDWPVCCHKAAAKTTGMPGADVCCCMPTLDGPFACS